MGDSDLWRADGSFRGIQSSGSGGRGKGGGGGGKGGPQFTRVIPKFLQKYHEQPAINAKFAVPPPPGGGDDDGDDNELDDVQQAAIDEYLEKNKVKTDGESTGDASANTADGDTGGVSDKSSSATAKAGKKKKSSQVVADVGASSVSTQPLKKKRKRNDVAPLSNKKLLSFSMDDE